MTKHSHVEHHFQAKDTLRDIVIGMSDGLTVPFALAAGLSGASAACRLIVTAGMAEIIAGSIAMGLGGYLAARGDADHYESEYVREHKEVIEIPEEEKLEVRTVFKEYGLRDEEIAPIVTALSLRPDDWVKFMMRFELGIERPLPGRALSSALTISVSYIIGGLIPLAPYMFLQDARQASIDSVALTLCALAIFGWAKGWFIGARPIVSAVQTVTIGAVAAYAAFAIAHLIK